MKNDFYYKNALEMIFTVEMHWKMNFTITMHWKWFLYCRNALENVFYYRNVLK